MVIKGYRKIKEIVIFGWICTIAIFVGEVIEFKIIVLPFLCFVVSIIMSFSVWIAWGRELVLDKEGIEVCFLKYKKKYLWEEFQTKQLIDFRNAHGSNAIYDKGALFSVKYLIRPRCLALGYYSDIFHPWHAIYINFYSQNDLHYESPANRYLADEKEFMAKMQEWGIELEEKDSIFSNPK